MKKAVTAVSAALLLSASAGLAYADGKATFTANCSACHGAKGEGGPIGPALKGNAFITKEKPEDIKKVIENGRKGSDKKYPKIPGDMLPWKDKIKDADIDAVIQYLQTDLQK